MHNCPILHTLHIEFTLIAFVYIEAWDDGVVPNANSYVCHASYHFYYYLILGVLILVSNLQNGISMGNG